MAGHYDWQLNPGRWVGGTNTSTLMWYQSLIWWMEAFISVKCLHWAASSITHATESFSTSIVAAAVIVSLHHITVSHRTATGEFISSAGYHPLTPVMLLWLNVQRFVVQVCSVFTLSVYLCCSIGAPVHQLPDHDSDGGTPSTREDLHLQKAHQIPELDRRFNKRYHFTACGYRETLNHRVNCENGVGRWHFIQNL